MANDVNVSAMGSQGVARRTSKAKAFMLSPTECLLNSKLKRQLDLPQAFMKAYRDPRFPDGLLVSFTLDDKPVGQERRAAVTWGKNRISRTGRVSLKHKLCLNDTIPPLPPDAFVHTVIASGPQQLIVACRTSQYAPQQQQRPQQRSPAAQQLPLQAQHTHQAAVDAPPAAKRRLHEAASKSVTSAAKRQRIRQISAGQVAAAAACTPHGGQQRIQASGTGRCYRMLQKLHVYSANLRLPGRLAKQLLEPSAAAAKPQLRPVQVQLWCQQAINSAQHGKAAAGSARETWLECQIVSQPSMGTGQRSAGYKLVGAGLQEQLSKYTGCSIVAARLLAGVGRKVCFEVAPAAGAAAAATTVQLPLQRLLQQEQEQHLLQPLPAAEAAADTAVAVECTDEARPVAAAPVRPGETSSVDGITSDSAYSGNELHGTSSCPESADDASWAHERDSDVELLSGSQQQPEPQPPGLGTMRAALAGHSKRTAADGGDAAAGRGGTLGGSFSNRGLGGGSFQPPGQGGANAAPGGAGGHSGGNSGGDGSAGGNSRGDFAGSGAKQWASKEFIHMNQNVTKRQPELPGGFLEGCFPQLRDGEVGARFDMQVQLLLLPPGLAAAADVTPHTPGVDVLVSNLAMGIKKRKPHVRQRSISSTAAEGPQEQQQQQQAVLRYGINGPLLAGFVSRAAGSETENIWAVGAAKSGPFHLLLMYSTEAPAGSPNRTPHQQKAPSAAAQPAAAAATDVTDAAAPFAILKRKMDKAVVIPKAFILQHLPEIEKLQHSDELQIDVELVHVSPGELDISSAAINRQNCLRMRGRVRCNAICDRTCIEGVCSATYAGWWLVGMRKLGETFLQLLITPTEPAWAAPHPKAGSGGGSSSMHAAMQAPISRGGSFTGQKGQNTVQQQSSGQSGSLAAARPFYAAAAAPFSSGKGGAAQDSDDGSSSDSGSDDEDLDDVIRSGEQPGAGGTGQPAAAAGPRLSSFDYAHLEPRKVVQNLFNAPRLPLDLVNNFDPSFPTKAGSSYDRGAPLDVEVVWLPPGMAQMSPDVQPLDVVPCPGSKVVKKYSKTKRDSDKVHTRYYVTGPSLQKALNEIAAKAQAAAGAAAVALAGDDEFCEPPVWLVGLQPTGPAALRLLLTSQLPPDAKPYKFRKSRLERRESRLAAAAERRAAEGEGFGTQPSAGSGIARTKGSGGSYWPCVKRRQPATAAAGNLNTSQRSGLQRQVLLMNRSGSGGMGAGGSATQPTQHGSRPLLHTGSGAAGNTSNQQDAPAQQQQQLPRQHSGTKREQQLQQQPAGLVQYFHDPLLERGVKRSRLSVASAQVEQQQQAATRRIIQGEQQAGVAAVQSGAAAAAAAVANPAAANLQPQGRHNVPAGAAEHGGVRLPALHNPRKPVGTTVGTGKRIGATQQQQHPAKAGLPGLQKGAREVGHSGSKSGTAFLAHIVSNIGRGLQFSDTAEKKSNAEDDMQPLAAALATETYKDEAAEQQQQQQQVPQQAQQKDALGAQAIQQQQHRRSEYSAGAFGSVAAVASWSAGRGVPAEPTAGAAAGPQQPLASNASAVAAAAEWEQWQQALPLPKQQQQQQRSPGSKLPADLLDIWRPVGAQKRQKQQQTATAAPLSEPSLERQRLSSTDKGLKVRLSCWQASLPGLQLLACSNVRVAVQFVDAANGELLGGPDDCWVRYDGSEYVRLRYSDELKPSVQALDGATAVRLSFSSGAGSSSDSNEVPGVISIHVEPASAANQQQGGPQAAKALEQPEQAAALQPQPEEALGPSSGPLLQQEQQEKQQLTLAQVPPVVREQQPQQQQPQQQQQQHEGVPPLPANLTAAACEEIQQFSNEALGASADAVQLQPRQQLYSGHRSGQQVEQQQSTPQLRHEQTQQQHLGMQPSVESKLLSRVLIKSDPEGLQQQQALQQLPVGGDTARPTSEQAVGGQHQVAVKPEHHAGIFAALQQQAVQQEVCEGSERGQQQTPQQLEAQREVAAQQAGGVVGGDVQSPHTSQAADAGGAMSDADGSATPPPASYTAVAQGRAPAQQQQPLLRPAAASPAGTAAPATSDHSQQPVSAVVGGSAGTSAAAAAVGVMQLQALPAADAVNDEVEDSLLQLINDLQSMGYLTDDTAVECMEAVEQLQPQEGDAEGNAALTGKFIRMYRLLSVAVRNNNARLAAALLCKHLLQKQGWQSQRQ